MIWEWFYFSKYLMTIVVWWVHCIVATSTEAQVTFAHLQAFIFSSFIFCGSHIIDKCFDLSFVNKLRKGSLWIDDFRLIKCNPSITKHLKSQHNLTFNVKKIKPKTTLVICSSKRGVEKTLISKHCYCISVNWFNLKTD